MATELPFASESFSVVIAQHAFEHSLRPEQSATELARVLTPEGLALVFGFNPLGTWRPWLEWSRRRAGLPLYLRSANTWRQLLLREQVDSLQVSFPGVWLPRGGLTIADRGQAPGPDARFGSSWLLVARKRRSSLTPLRQRLRNRELALHPRLVPGAQRART
ncbi:MAG: methyltransferase domain-containing protein [Rudaea sp.]